jgi:hypothetical protein
MVGHCLASALYDPEQLVRNLQKRIAGVPIGTGFVSFRQKNGRSSRYLCLLKPADRSCSSAIGTRSALCVPFISGITLAVLGFENFKEASRFKKPRGGVFHAMVAGSIGACHFAGAPAADITAHPSSRADASTAPRKMVTSVASCESGPGPVTGEAFSAFAPVFTPAFAFVLEIEAHSTCSSNQVLFGTLGPRHGNNVIMRCSVG